MFLFGFSSLSWAFICLFMILCVFNMFLFVLYLVSKVLDVFKGFSTFLLFLYVCLAFFEKCFCFLLVFFCAETAAQKISSSGPNGDFQRSRHFFVSSRMAVAVRVAWRRCGREEWHRLE